jgi:hypothetical protein
MEESMKPRIGGAARVPFVLSYMLLASTLLTPVEASAQNAEQDVVAVVERLFEGMRTRDTTMLRSVFDPSARLYGVNRDGAVRASAPDDFIRSVGGREGPMLDEKVFAPHVQIDGDLASVWTFYTLHIGDQFSHCGIDAFMLLRVANQWKIVSLADTRRQENCEPPK